MKSRHTSRHSSLRRLAASAGLLLAAAAAWAQYGALVPVPNQRNPFPKIHHDPQNTGRAVEEPYWGVTNGNRAFNADVRSRIFGDAGWVFPRESALASADGDLSQTSGNLTWANETTGNTTLNWEVQNAGTPAPSTEFLQSYHRREARGRVSQALAEDPFEWNVDVVGTAGARTRYRIYVWVPARDQAEPITEDRVTDARYFVRYRKDNGGDLVRYTTWTGSSQNNNQAIPLYVNQDVTVSGWYPLRTEDGELGPFFPVYPGAGPDLVVSLDNTTENDGTRRFVLADDIQLRPQTNMVRTTPVITGPHGGRLLVNDRQPASTIVNYTSADFTPSTLQGYINAIADPAAGDTDAVGTPSQRSSLYQGPPEFLQREGDPIVTTFSPTGQLLFSHVQVLVARTEFVADPNDPSGTGSIEAGSIYALDWLTGAPVWRFPDRSYLPQTGTDPFVGSRNLVNGVVTIPGIRGIDNDGDGTIADDEVYTVGVGPNTGGGFNSSVTFAPRVPVQGVVQVPNAARDGIASVNVSKAGLPVNLPLAYAACNNGVVYALDAYGNSDSSYSLVNGTVTGTIATRSFTPGTTNVYWTFYGDRRVTVEQDNDSPGSGGWPVATGPSTAYQGTNYSRIPAVDRNDTNAVPSYFTWDPPATQLTPGYYAVYIRLPSPGPNEPRIGDARYSYQDADTGTYTNIAPLVGQGGGQRRLGGPNFVMRYEPNQPFSLRLENTTASFDPDNVPFVLADMAVFVPIGAGVPNPASFTSSPVLAFADPDTTTPASDPENPNSAEHVRNEQRLFVGNDNGVLYAINAQANAPAQAPGGNTRLPFRKFPRWWFIAEGAISSTPAASKDVIADTGGTGAARRAIYFTSQEGRAYAVDWNGPVTDSDRTVTLGAYNPAMPLETSDPLNDAAVARPRWAFPQRYATDPNDNGNFGPIVASPSFVQYTANGQTRTYLAVVAPDDATPASAGRLYLLDAAGNRSTLTTSLLDRYAPNEPVSAATPAWMFRFTYGDDEAAEYPIPASSTSRIVPKRRTRPTIFFGGIGTVYAVDIDPATDRFQRWPATVSDATFPGPLPGPAPTAPPFVPARDYNPPLFDSDPFTAYQDQPILARVTELNESAASRVSGIVISGGPLQRRDSGDAGNPNDNVPNPTYDPRDTAVNQNINDPETAEVASFQYPSLFVTAEGGGLYQLSSNIAGEDIIDASNTGALGWALSNDPARRNVYQVQLYARTNGPGGVSTPALFANVAFEDLDPYEGDGAGTPPFAPDGRDAGDTHTGQTGLPLDSQGLYNDPTVDIASVDPADPAAQDQQGALQIPWQPRTQNSNQELGNRITWVYTGGLDGTVYAYTPGDFNGGGGSAGTGPGGRPGPFPGRSYLYGDPKVDIFSDADFTTLTNTPQRPNRDGSQPPVGGGEGIHSKAYNGENNFYEWGETVKIVVWDLNARTEAEAAEGEWYAEDNSVTVTITNRQTGASLPARQLDLHRVNGVRFTYDNDPSYDAPDQPPASTNPAPVRPKLGLALLEFPVEGQTPGHYFEVRVTQRIKQKRAGGATRTVTVGIGNAGATDQAILYRLTPIFAIANPIAVNADLLSTTGKAIDFGTTGNFIGPVGGSRNNVFPKQADQTTPPTSANDPNLSAYNYSQALTNGNSIQRRDYRPYGNAALPATPVTRNTQFKQPIATDPLFYIPVASSLGYVGHGSPGSTNGRLLIGNRSALPSLGRVRMVRADYLWRWWPTTIPNEDASSTNARLTPAGMSDTGVINPLPWDQAPQEVKPWKRPGQDLTPAATNIVGANTSRDYPDIVKENVSATSPSGGNLTAAPGSLPRVTSPGAMPRVDVQVKVPSYQPANLAAVTSLTSTYVAPSAEDTNATPQQQASAVIPQGPLQLPRDISNRLLSADGSRAITPFGYTSRQYVFVDSNLDGKLNLSAGIARATGPAFSGVDYSSPDVTRQGTGEEAFREFETWMGVPVDMQIKAQETIIDFGKLPHGFGIQNGLLGYDPGNVNQPGFTPPPFNNSAYAPFMKTFRIQNRGNTNLYNLRAAQRFSTVTGGSSILSEIGLKSDIVNPSFGINGYGIDPWRADRQFDYNSAHVVTSLDRSFDTLWHSITGAVGYPGIYADFKGMHPLHKARPGAPAPTLLSIPDSPDNAPIPPGAIYTPYVGVSVPIGTPSGEYTAPLAFFEDHDTPANPANASDSRAYRGAPQISGSTILPAGPLYGGQNREHPGRLITQPGQSVLLTGTGPLTEGILRPRGITSGANGAQLEFLPYTDPSVLLKLTVKESQLTGQVSDTIGTAGTGAAVTGVLPFVDPFPLVAGNRPAAALTPAAYRSATSGSLYVYFSRNASDATTAVTGVADPFNLFWSKLTWDVSNGAWKADDPGAPLDPAQVTTSTARWFTPPALVSIADIGGSNTSPFVLHDVNGSNETATLFWLNTTGGLGTPQVNRIYWSALTDGEPQTPAHYRPATFDPAIRRYGPKAVLADSDVNDGTDSKDTLFVMYYGGTPGRWSLLYGVTNVANGGPVDNPSREVTLPLPAAISSAAEPTPVFRAVANPLNLSERIPVVDVYFTALSRVNTNADIYMTRYRVNNAGRNASLQQVPLPRVVRERMVATQGGQLFTARHIDWWRSFNNRNLLPRIYVAANASATPAELAPNMHQRWQYDEATGLLFQRFPDDNLPVSLVYVDPSSGTVRFRGPASPTGNQQVYVDYTPQSYRLSTDAASDVAPTAFFDRSILPATTGTNTVIRRQSALPVDRQWVAWQKAGLPNRTATIYWNARRIGIDLKAIPVAEGGMAAGESIALTPQGGNGNQTPRVSAVEASADGSSYSAVPYEVDFNKGQIYVSAEHEGRYVRVTYTAFVPSNANGVPAEEARTVGGTPATQRVLSWIDEGTSNVNAFEGTAVRLTNPLNEGQPLLFRDAFDPRPASTNRRYYDPTLQPGRMWLFWTSPVGQAYDIYWQTLVPNFESATYPGLPAPP